MARSNRLAKETSPYLLQHAHNPVDWYPWGDEAFDEARRRNKPVLLSIGYSSCHWCHVMERECFDDDGIAALMNDLFVSIKVDREERPTSTTSTCARPAPDRPRRLAAHGVSHPRPKALSRRNVFPADRSARIVGFPRVLRAVAQAYHERPDDVARSTNDLEGIASTEKPGPTAAALDPTLPPPVPPTRSFGTSIATTAASAARRSFLTGRSSRCSCAGTQ